MKKSPRTIPLPDRPTLSPAETLSRSSAFYDEVRQRRTVRNFSDAAIDRAVIENCLRAAGTAPNGANLQPWHFAVIESSRIKSEIRKRAEAEERIFYEQRAPDEWLKALAPLGTSAEKPFLEHAPCLIAIFSRTYGFEEGGKVKHYYVNESVGIAVGILITALHHCGLSTLIHTPSPMRFLNEILDRPANERPFALLVVGYPEQGTRVPDITKKSLQDISTFH